MQQGEIDWWENPSLDLIPQIKTYKDVTLAVKDRTGEMGCLRFNQLFPPFDNPAIRRDRGRRDGPAGSDGSGLRRGTVTV